MGMEKVKCPETGTYVNKASRCPDCIHKDCPELLKLKGQTQKLTTKEKTKRTFQFSSEERKVFGEGGFYLAEQIYKFLRDFIANHEEDKIREFYWKYEEFKEYLQRFPLLKKHSLIDDYIEDLYALSYLIYKHRKQKKDIPLDCYLYELKQRTLTEERLEEILERLRHLEKLDLTLFEKEAEEELKEIKRESKGMVKIDPIIEKLSEKGYSFTKESLKKRIYRVTETEHIKEIHRLAKNLLKF